MSVKRLLMSTLLRGRYYVALSSVQGSVAYNAYNKKASPEARLLTGPTHEKSKRKSNLGIVPERAPSWDGKESQPPMRPVRLPRRALAD